MSSILDQILANFPDEEFLKADGFDDAVIGVEYVSNRLVYDIHVMIAILMQEGMSEEDAWEHFAYNIGGAYVGDKTPIFVSM